MKKILVTGGTVFVSCYVAEYFAKAGHEVYVLNRNHRPQPENTTLIEADRHELGERLRDYHFDAVLDVTAYNGQDVSDLLDALGEFKTYILISSSAVYPETERQPFTEDTPTGENRIWGKYGTDKIDAEKVLTARVPEAYILRPPYLYGPMNNVYREAFVFDCALQDRSFCLPKDGSMKLQFFHVRDLCRVMERILEEQPAQHIFNVGNEEAVSIREWVALCYEALGKSPVYREVWDQPNQRDYFSFYEYEYFLDVGRQRELLPNTTGLVQGLKEAADWYLAHRDLVARKPYLTYIDDHILNRQS